MRRTCFETVLKLQKKNKKIIFVGSDLGPGFMKHSKDKVPERFFMEGVSEQSIVGMAAGLALEGYLPFVNTIATLITRSKENRIGPFELGTDGSGYNALELPQGKNEVVMNGAKVLTFAMSIVPDNVKMLLKKTKTNINKIDMFVFHQASKYILENINRKLSIPKEKTYENYSKVGNTISASIPIALKDGCKKKIKNNHKIVVAGYGVGLSWGSAIIKWKKLK